MPDKVNKMSEIVLDIGDMPILLRTDCGEFARMIEHRYAAFANPRSGPPVMALDVKLLPSPEGWRWDQGLDEPVAETAGADSSAEDDAAAVLLDPDDDVKVSLSGDQWTMQRGDFRAEWNPATRRGWVQQTINPYSIDGVLRILHSLILAREGGLLIHGASSVRDGKAFIFAGISGTGKTTISRLAPADVKLLTDEISYVRDTGNKAESSQQTAESPRATASFIAYGTPFAGELAKIGEKLKAPLAALFLLKQGPENRIEEVSEAQAVRELMRHILFFAHDSDLVNKVFDTVCHLVRGTPVRRLVFKKDSSVWELIG